jgi:hypothetical protein
LEFASGSGSTPKGAAKLDSVEKVKSVKAVTAKQVDRSAQALRRLKVSPAQLAAAPEITPLLKQASGGLKQVLTAMRFAPDDLIASFLLKYDSIPVGDRECLPMEAIAVAAELNVSHLLGSIMMALQAQSVNAVKIIAMTAHPKITEARVMYGLMPLGERDRTALDTAMGFLPSPKGPTFINKTIFQSGKSQTSGDGDEDDDGEPDIDRIFPPANAMQEKLTPIRQRQLPPG